MKGYKLITTSIFTAISALITGIVEASEVGRMDQSSADIIHACIQQENGQLRVVSGPGQCRPSEIPINWNASGPKGDKGDPGKQGPSCQETTNIAFVGFSKERYHGDGTELSEQPLTATSQSPGGLLRFHNACNSTYPDSRMCNTQDILLGIGHKEPPEAHAAWIHPSFIFSSSGVGDSATGYRGDALRDLSCRTWSTQSGLEKGLTISRAGISHLDCAHPRPIACCAPVPLKSQ